MEEEAFYDSDEGVAWGPMSLKEMKNRLEIPAKNLLSRRATDNGFFPMSSNQSSISNTSKNTDDKSNTSGTSVYITPEDSFRLNQPPNQNEKFLDTLSKIIDSDPETPKLASLGDNTNLLRDTLYNIIETPMNRHCENLDSVQQTLVQNSPNCESENVLDLSDDSESSVITISSSDSEEAYNAEKVKEERLLTCNNLESETKQEGTYLKSRTENCREENVWRDESEGSKDQELSEQYAEITEIEECNDSRMLSRDISQSSLSSTEPLTVNTTGSSNNIYNKDPIPPKITVEDCSILSDEDESVSKLNDTLEEMELALKEGLDYVMPCSDPSVKIPYKFATPQVTPAFKSLQKKKFDYIESPVANYIRNSPDTPRFAVPLPKPLHHEKSKIPVSDKFKNIVSPVGVYIKNAPGFHLKRNKGNNVATELFTRKEVLGSPSTSNKENTPIEFDTVFYKQAKQKIILSQEEHKLPSSIQGMVPSSLISTHNRKVNRREDKNLIMETDLTLLESSSMLNSTDASFLTTKQGFIK